ncbi:hypothetical protein T484DRAFT_1907080, partial [Baffinella frigidus]
MDAGQTVVAAFYVSSFCVQRLGAELLGVRLAINGRMVVEQPLLIHGNDGSAQYHVSIPGLPSGVFELRASLSLDAASSTTVDDAVSSIEVLAPHTDDDDEQRPPASPSDAGGSEWDGTGERAWEMLIGGCSREFGGNNGSDSKPGYPMGDVLPGGE